MRAFIDSDVIISSLISSSGASYFLLHTSRVVPVISSLSVVELRIVSKRLGIDEHKLDQLIKEKFEVIDTKLGKEDVVKKYKEYVTDTNDSHIVWGADNSKVKFLISYNLKHFKRDLIKEKLDVLVMTPALFLQYLRSN